MKSPSALAFISYGRLDGADFVDRLVVALGEHGFEAWRDTEQIVAAARWEEVISDAIDRCDVVIAVLTPHAVRRQTGASDIDSVCLDELSYARFGPTPKPVIPIMATSCQVPFSVFRFTYVDMTKWAESDDDFNSGIQKVVSYMRAVTTGTPSELRQPEWLGLDQGPYLHEKRSGFTGRDWLFDRVNAWARHSRERALLVVGDPGIGKSAFMAELAHRNEDGRVIAYHACTRDDQRTLEPGTFVRNLVAMLAKRLPPFAEKTATISVHKALMDAADYPGHALDVAVLAPLSQMPIIADSPYLILVDALDEAMLLQPGISPEGTIVSLLASRIDRLPEWLRLLVTARRDRRTIEELTGLRATIIDAQAVKNLRDLSVFVDSRLLETSGPEPRYEVAREIVRVADGNFLHAKMLLRGFERGQISASSLNVLSTGVSGFYGRQFHRLSQSVDSHAMRTVLEP